ncbi:HVA22-like protein k [Auxenochlorella protothecoides]|uniref:HVA22-like protein n=1 Tax=Auxenochlorella protothecoides TaxID=3075 RepID=A0A087SPV2_AUXPR|nr:HVA22-like protein k [Auxenochlorella protothecoides]KFM27756.1 HVA22-like protein k [Auxenochlorella protothecoides]
MSALFSGVATELGLQVILKPYDNAIGRGFCLLAGLAYPTFASLRALDGAADQRSSQNASEVRKWLRYWSVHGTLTAAELLLNKSVTWVPYYHVIKFAFLLWLQLPRFEGAARLSRDVLDPAAKQAAPLVDLGLANLALLFSNPVLAGAEARLQSLAAQFPVLEWFMRRPSGRF